MPNAPEVGADRGPNKIVLKIIKPEGGVDNYTVTCTRSMGQTCYPSMSTVPEPNNGQPVLVTYNNLTPFEEYTYVVRSVKDTKMSNEVHKTFKTEEARKYILTNLCPELHLAVYYLATLLCSVSILGIHILGVIFPSLKKNKGNLP